MGHLRTPQADSDLDEIWYYIAIKSRSVEVADRLIDSITDRFFLLASHPNVGRARDEDLRPGLRSSNGTSHYYPLVVVIEMAKSLHRFTGNKSSIKRNKARKSD